MTMSGGHDNVAKDLCQQRDRFRKLLGDLRPTLAGAQTRIDELETENSDLKLQIRQLEKQREKLYEENNRGSDQRADRLRSGRTAGKAASTDTRTRRRAGSRSSSSSASEIIESSSESSDTEEPAALVKTETKIPVSQAKRAADISSDDDDDDESSSRRHPKKTKRSIAKGKESAPSDDARYMPPTPVYTMDVDRVPTFKFQRITFHETYRGNRMSIISSLADGQQVLMVNTLFNPTIPDRPGASGYLWTSNSWIPEHKKWKLIVRCEKATPQTWENRGDYHVYRHGVVSGDDFMTGPPIVRKSWAKCLAGSEKIPGSYSTGLRARIAERKKQRNQPGEVTHADIIEAIGSGEETIRELEMKFIGYDEPFVERLKTTASVRGIIAPSHTRGKSKKAGDRPVSEKPTSEGDRTADSASTSTHQLRVRQAVPSWSHSNDLNASDSEGGSVEDNDASIHRGDDADDDYIA